MHLEIFVQDPDTEDRRQRVLDAIKRIEQFQRDNQVKPFGLKILSAMAICKKFKDSEEILNLGPSAMIRWNGDRCLEDCESDGDIYCEYCRYMLWKRMFPNVPFGTCTPNGCMHHCIQSSRVPKFSGPGWHRRAKGHVYSFTPTMTCIVDSAGIITWHKDIKLRKFS